MPRLISNLQAIMEVLQGVSLDVDAVQGEEATAGASFCLLSETH